MIIIHGVNNLQERMCRFGGERWDALRYGVNHTFEQGVG